MGPPPKEPEKIEDVLLTRMKNRWEELDHVFEVVSQTMKEEEDKLRDTLEVAVLSGRRNDAIVGELEEMNSIEANAQRDYNAIQLEEIGLTDAVKKRHVQIITKKVKEAAQSLEEWEQVYDKWKTKAGKAAKSGERVTQFVQDLGIKAISDEETGKFSGIGLSRIIPSHPDYEGIIYFSDFNLSDWSFNEILSVDPTFPGWKACVAECNRRRDLVYALSSIRSRWEIYFTRLVNPGNVVDEHNKSSSNTSNSFVNKSSSINSSFNKSGNNSSVLFEDSV